MKNRQQIIANIMQNMGATVRLVSKNQPPKVPGGPTHAQQAVLVMIAHLGVQNTKDLAQKLDMTSSAVTQLVDGLVHEKLITRHEDASDRRIIRLELTVRGRQRLALLTKQRLKFLIKLFLPLTDADLKHLQHIQNKIIESLAHAKNR